MRATRGRRRIRRSTARRQAAAVSVAGRVDRHGDAQGTGRKFPGSLAFRYALLALLIHAAPGSLALAEPVNPQRVPALVTGAYDGDTIEVSAELWPGLTWGGSVRVLGVDAPEIRGQCAREREVALRARDMVRGLLVGELVLLADVKDDKYGGRVDAVVLLEDGRDLAAIPIAAGLGRPYDGGSREGWCD